MIRTISSVIMGFTALGLLSCTALKPAPEGHQPILENQRVRVMEVLLPPGGKVPLHNHDLPGVIIVDQTSVSIVRDAKGKVVSKGAPPKGAYWVTAHGPHYSIENAGKTTMHLYRVEVK